MGFSNTATTLTINAKLTAYGRQQLLSNSSNVITHFALGDSDANYNATLPLTTGEVPVGSGDLSYNLEAGSLASGYIPRSVLFYDSIGSKKKSVTDNSNELITTTELFGVSTLSGDSLTQYLVDKNDYATDSLVNLFYSFRLPITQPDFQIFTATTSANSGFADTAISGLAQEKILVIGIENVAYGEMIDGKSIKVELTTTGSSAYTIYSTFEKTLTASKVQDARYKETSFNSTIFGNNIAYLFSDEVQTPNNDPSLSWATGYGEAKPFSVGGKYQFNMYNNTVTSTVADKAVGVAFLDKGFVVITHPDIVNNYDPLSSGGTATTVTLNSIATKITQEVTCIADRGEFATSNNRTFSLGDTPRISEIILMDASENVIALAKTDRHIQKTAQQFMAIGVKISV